MEISCLTTIFYMRRNRKKLEQAIEGARDERTMAVACFALAVFHDNNSREAEAIPLYRKALKLGLERKERAEALAWLASSLYKTGKVQEALGCIEEAMGIAEGELVRFLEGLKGRISG